MIAIYARFTHRKYTIVRHNNLTHNMCIKFKTYTQTEKYLSRFKQLSTLIYKIVL